MTDKAELEALAVRLGLTETYFTAYESANARNAIRALLAENERLEQQLADTKTMLQATGEALAKARQALQETDNAG